MTNVIKTFEIGKVYMPKTTYTTKTYENLLLAIKDKGLKITTAKAGLNIDAGTGVEAQLVCPNSDSYDNLNNYSAVLRINYGNTSFLFTGDAESLAETEMANSGYTLKSDVLKVGHHGSDSSTAQAFVKAVSSKYAVKKFHLPSCGSLPAPQNRVIFDKRDEAVKAGYEPCKICKP
jgi:competence protein ComEC